MTESKPPHSDYVQKVRDDTQLYLRELLAETDRLRRVATEATAEVHRLGEENRALGVRLREREEELARFRDEHAQLADQLSATTNERERFLRDFVDLEQRNNDLANLYVATYRLHGTLDEQDVLTAIAEIVINLIGCEQFGLFDLDRSSRELRLIHGFGLPAHVDPKLDASQGILGRAVELGEVVVLEDGVASPLPHEQGLTACVPLKVGTRVSGALLLFELLPQKRGRLAAIDSELLELLASQAGPAVHASRALARTTAAEN
jgi:transcriptional regulator with GAF, ATPase, and Fis domain